MNTKEINRLLKALKSGTYRKGTGQLRNKNNQYCCLGVYCEISEAKWDETITGFINHSVDGIEGVLPEELTEKIGFNEEGEFSDFGKQVCRELFKKEYESIADLNDSTIGFTKVIQFLEKAVELKKKNRKSCFL